MQSYRLLTIKFLQNYLFCIKYATEAIMTSALCLKNKNINNKIKL